MRVLLVLCSIALALGRPQGYNYNLADTFAALRAVRPAPLCEVETEQTSTLPTGSRLAHETDQNSDASVPTAFDATQQTLAVQTGSQTNQGLGSTPGTLSVAQNAILSSPEAQQFLTVRTEALAGRAAVKTVTVSPSTPAPIVSKYFYLHSAPEDENEAEASNLSVGPARKHYRVVFIKAPSGNLKGALRALSHAQREEKTAIYVLTKKPDLVGLKQLAEETPRTPSKPEVFFIKYKTPEEAAHAQQQIQARYDALGGTSEVSDEGLAPVTSVIGSLDQASKQAPATDPSDAEASALSSSRAAATNGDYLPPLY